MMPKSVLVALSSLALVLVAAPGVARAEENGGQGKVTTIPTIQIEGRAPRPAAAVEVSRVRMQLPASTPTLSAIVRIESASKKAPF